MPITDYCDRNNLATQQRLELFIAVGRAVQHAHQKGIIHRDLKPSNVLVTLRDGTAVPKVIDFGISKAINQQLTEKTLFTAYGQMVGTPEYMSPEQAAISELDVDTRSDVYSLGVLLYELLTGSTPLEVERLRTVGYAEMQRLIREEEPPKPSTRLSSSGEDLAIIAKHRSANPDGLQRLVRGDLDWIVMKALEKERSQRYESASEFCTDVQRHLDDEPIIACPPTKMRRFRRFGRRHKMALASAAIVAATLTLGLASTIVLAIRAIQAEHKNAKLLDDLQIQLLDWATYATFIGDYKEAQKTLRLARNAGAEPDCVETLSALNDFFVGDIESAVNTLEETKTSYPDSLMVLSALPVVYAFAWRHAEYAEAFVAFDEHSFDPVHRYERLLVAQVYAYTRPQQAIRMLQAERDEQQSPGLLDAMLAQAYGILALDTTKLDDALQAVKHAKRSRTLLPDSSYAALEGLFANRCAMFLGGHDLRSTEKWKEWKEDADRAAAKLGEFPQYVAGRVGRARYYRFMAMTDEYKDETDALLELGVGGVWARVANAYAARDGATLESLLGENDIKLHPHLGICKGIVEADRDSEEAWTLYWRSVKTGDRLARWFGIDLLMLLGDKDSAQRVANELLSSGALDQAADFAKVAAKFFAEGCSDEQEVLKQAAVDRECRGNLYYYLGLSAITRGDRWSARSYFSMAVSHRGVEHRQYHWAKAFLGRLQESEEWPK